MKIEAKSRLLAGKLTPAQRGLMAGDIIDAMRKAYEAEGEEGDFADGLRHLRYDADDAELISEYKKYCKKPIPKSF